MSAIPKMSHVSVGVVDLARAIALLGMLGWKFKNTVVELGSSHTFFFAHPDGGPSIQLIFEDTDEFADKATKDDTRHVSRIGLVCSSVKDTTNEIQQFCDAGNLSFGCETVGRNNMLITVKDIFTDTALELIQDPEITIKP